MSSIMSTQGIVMAATAMAAFSGTVIILALKIQKSIPSSSSSSQFQVNPLPILRPCLSSGERKEEKKKKKKKVRFAEDVVDPTGDNEEFRKHHVNGINNSKKIINGVEKNRGMPANRVALYNGILRDRVIHRMTCTY